MVCTCKTDLEIDMVVRSPELLPEYANETDACMDLKVDLHTTLDDKDTVLAIPAGHTIKVPTGLKVKIPVDYVMEIYPRSSTGLKLNCMLANTVGIIDSGYRDEVMLLLHNFGETAVYLNHAQRVAQFKVTPRPKVKINIVEDDEEFKTGNRGGGLGSTGK